MYSTYMFHVYKPAKQLDEFMGLIFLHQVCLQCHADLLKCTEQNVKDHSLIKVSQFYVHISFCRKIIRS